MVETDADQELNYRNSLSMSDRILLLEKDVIWLKKLYKSLDTKTWGILVAIIINILIVVLLKVI